MPKYSNIPPKADYLPFASWDGEEWLFPSADAIRKDVVFGNLYVNDVVCITLTPWR